MTRVTLFILTASTLVTAYAAESAPLAYEINPGSNIPSPSPIENTPIEDPHIHESPKQ